MKTTYTAQTLNAWDAPRAYRDGQQIGSYQPQLELDLRDGTISIEVEGRALWYSPGTPVEEYHGIVRTWTIPSDCDLEDLEEDLLNTASTLRQLLERVGVGGSVEWDGHNFVGRLTDDAHEAREEIERYFSDSHSYPRSSWAAWDTAAWLEPNGQDFLGITATCTDEELDGLVSAVEEDAATDHVVLYDVVEALRRYRDRLAGEDEDEAA